MAKPESYTQCLLETLSPAPGTDKLIRSLQRVWIPSSFAVKEKSILVKEIIPGRAEPYWKPYTVKEIGSTLSAEYMQEYEADYRRQRKASDIEEVPTTVRDSLNKEPRNG